MWTVRPHLRRARGLYFLLDADVHMHCLYEKKDYQEKEVLSPSHFFREGTEIVEVMQLTTQPSFDGELLFIINCNLLYNSSCFFHSLGKIVIM